MIIAPANKKQRSTIRLMPVYLSITAGAKSGESALPQHVRRARNAVFLPDSLRVRFVELIGEDVVELTVGEGDHAVVVEGVGENGEDGFHGREGKDVDARRASSGNAYACAAEASVQEQLGEEAAEGVAHYYGWSVEVPDYLLVVVDDVVDGEAL
jgi:DNA-binding IclR family transcriptional regulator